MTKPVLSVILPNYNHAKFLEQNLVNILTQSYPADEILILDDASTDNSMEVIERFARRYPRVKYYHNDQNLGAAKSLSRLLELAQGEYVYGASADDVVLPGFFEKCLNLLQRYPQASLCCGPPSLICGRTGHIVEYRNNWGNARRYFSPEDLALAIRISSVKTGVPAHAIWKKAAFLQTGGYRENLLCASDWFPLQVMAFRHGICYVPEPLALFRVNTNSFSDDLRVFGERQSKVFNAMLHLAKEPAFHDVHGLFRRANIFCQFSPVIVETVVRNPEHWDAATLNLIEPLLLGESERLLNDENPEVRLGAAICLGKLGWRGTKIMLALAAASNDREESVRATARLALDQHRGSTLWRLPGACTLLAWTVQALSWLRARGRQAKAHLRTLLRNLCAKIYQGLNYKLYARIQTLEKKLEQKDQWLEIKIETLTYWIHQMSENNKETTKTNLNKQARLVEKLKTLLEGLEKIAPTWEESHRVNGNHPIEQ